MWTGDSKATAGVHKGAKAPRPHLLHPPPSWERTQEKARTPLREGGSKSKQSNKQTIRNPLALCQKWYSDFAICKQAENGHRFLLIAPGRTPGCCCILPSSLSPKFEGSPDVVTPPPPHPRQLRPGPPWHVCTADNAGLLPILPTESRTSCDIFGGSTDTC